MYIVLKYFRILVYDFLLAINRILQSNALKVICLNNLYMLVLLIREKKLIDLKYVFYII